MSCSSTREGGVAIIRLDRPERRNAMDSALLRALLAALEDAHDARAVVISTTNVAALSAGADVDEDGGVDRMELFTRVYAGIEAHPAPTIAVCVGNCVGAGAEVAAGCDLRIGGDNLKLAWAGARHGVPVGPARLAPLIGTSRAKDWVFTGRVIGAEEALAAGFLHDAVRAEAAEQRALDLASSLGDVRQLKAMFREFDAAPDRVARENEHLMAFQRSGTGLPRRSSSQEA